MGLAHEKKSYLQEKANLFEIGSVDFQRYFPDGRVSGKSEKILRPLKKQSTERVYPGFSPMISHEERSSER